MEQWSAVTLPCGWWSENILHRSAFVRPLTGRDEEALLASNAATLPERISGLIAHGVGGLGSLDAVTEQQAAQLTVGDREALVLALRRLTLGERLQLVVYCGACREAMDIDLTIGELLVEPSGAPAPVYDDAIATPDGEWGLRYRLPTGADQVAVARTCADAPERGARALLGRCVLAAVSPTGEATDPAALPEPVAEAIGERMAARDPQAEIALDFACPACRTRGTVILDAADLFLRELTARGGGLYRDVHRLALHYHWSERDILALPHGKRRRYLALLAEALGDDA